MGVDTTAHDMKMEYHWAIRFRFFRWWRLPENTRNHENIPLSHALSCLSGLHQISLPIGSMYGIFNYIYYRTQPNVGRYTSPWILWVCTNQADSQMHSIAGIAHKDLFCWTKAIRPSNLRGFWRPKTHLWNKIYRNKVKEHWNSKLLWSAHLNLLINVHFSAKINYHISRQADSSFSTWKFKSWNFWHFTLCCRIFINLHGNLRTPLLFRHKGHGSIDLQGWMLKLIQNPAFFPVEKCWDFPG